MKQYAVTITRPALKDLEDIYNFHAAWDEERAERLYDTITGGILALDTMPLRYGVPQFEPCIILFSNKTLQFASAYFPPCVVVVLDGRQPTCVLRLA